MAFHGNRGYSKARVSAGGKSRKGGGFSSNLRARGRVRSAGRAGRRKPIFDSSRVAEEQEGNSAGEDEASAGKNEDREDSFSEDDTSDEENAAESRAVLPYTALLQSLSADSVPQAKRRKLENPLEKEVEKQELEDSPILKVDHGVDPMMDEEGGPEVAENGALEDDEQETEDVSDPFQSHFASPDDVLLSKRLEALGKGQWTVLKTSLSGVGKAVLSFPNGKDGNELFMPAAVSSFKDLKLKRRLAMSVTKEATTFDPLEQHIAPFIFNYNDVLFCNRNPTNSERLRRLVCLHAINHIFKTRDRVIKNNARFAKEDNNDDLDLRDQGFTRPKVLMLLPTRQSCVRFVETIVSLCGPEQQENRKRFDDSYVGREDSFSTDKPDDFRELFEGNDDDLFRLGMKFTRKTLKYFSKFYNSDIIFASPLGLRMVIGSEEDKKTDSDFLSSIELVVVDHADALLMQNWEHIEFIYEHLNLQPKEAHGCDFSRVRSWYLDNNARYFRQNITFAGFNTPELNTLFYNKSQNWRGKAKITAEYPGAIQELNLKVKQRFSRLESTSIVKDPDTRFTYFTTAIISAITRDLKNSAGTLIFIPSYLEFVRLRNHFSTSATAGEISFGSISEYTTVSDVARARSHFLTGRHNVLLYTERAHHFRRYHLRGVKKVIMYGLPDNPIFYKEIVAGFLSRTIQEGKLKPEDGNVWVIFSKWDVLKLERVVGTDRVGKLMKEKGDTFDFL